MHAPTGKEWRLISYLRQYVKEYMPEVQQQMDVYGNLYFTKGRSDNGYPTLVAHLDQVQQVHSPDFCVKQEAGRLYGWSEVHQQQEGLGADDKNGIWVCLLCLAHCPVLKVFLAVGEEKGCIGSYLARMNFFADSLYVLEPDCRGGSEVHTLLRGIPCASDDLVAALNLAANGYVQTEGKSSDILALTIRGVGVSCANIPVGYHLPHQDEEYTMMDELLHTYDFILHIVNTLRECFPYRYVSDTERWVTATLKGEDVSFNS